jgi:selenocysteine-specific elongation factor
MLAGVGGVDLLLLVVAADEAIKPQTREHFDICRLLGIGRGIVALTKTDLVEADWLDLVKLEVEEFVAGSFLEGAPVVGVSARTGAGLEELKTALAAEAQKAQPRDATGHFRLPVDRAFSVKGHGLVVTGTLMTGTVGVEDEVEVHPLGRRARVRSVEVHGGGKKRAEAGQRTALNLSGVETGEIRRGMALTAPGLFHPTSAIEAEVTMLAGAGGLKHGAPVHFHAGTAEVEAEARVLEGNSLGPGRTGLVRLLLHEPALLWPGDRFILRRFSPLATIGGGRVIGIDAPRRMRRAAAALRVKAIQREGVGALVREAEAGVAQEWLVARTGERAARIEKALPAGARILKLPQPWWIAEERADAIRARAAGLLEEFHRANPLERGMSREEARKRVLGEAPAALFEALVAGDARFAVEGDLLRLASHRVALQASEDEALGKMEGLFRAAGLAAPGVNEVLASSGVDSNKARALLQILLREKKLVRVNLDLILHADGVRELCERLAGMRGRRVSVPEFKEMTGVSRKYAIPLLEYLDRERLTRRDGDARIIL